MKKSKKKIIINIIILIFGLIFGYASVVYSFKATEGYLNLGILMSICVLVYDFSICLLLRPNLNARYKEKDYLDNIKNLADETDEIIENLRKTIEDYLPVSLDNTLETRNYLSKLKKVYIITCWASYGIMEFPFTGKYLDKNKTQPLVYQYDDHNGTCDNYFLRSIYDTTTGHILGWTFDKESAEQIANELEEKRKGK